MTDYLPFKTWIKKQAILVLLIGLGFLGNVIAPQLFTGFNYLFGSIAALLVLRLYGVIWGVIAAVVAASWCQVLFGHPTAMIWLGLEPVFIWLWLKKRPNGSMILAAAVYWLSIGSIMIFLLFSSVLKVPLLGTSAAALMYAMIGITNALVATVLLDFIPHGFYNGARRSSAPISQLLFHIMMLVILLPAIVVLVMDGRLREQHAITDILDDLETDTQHGIYEIKLILAENSLRNTTADNIPREVLKRIKTAISDVRSSASHQITILDVTGRVISSTNETLAEKEHYNPMEPGQILPTSRSGSVRRMPANDTPVPLWLRAGKSYFVRNLKIPGTTWRIAAETPFAPYQVKILAGHRNALTSLLVYVLAVLSLAMLVSKKLSAPLKQLTRLTTDLPQRLQSNAEIIWPDSAIYEVQQLADNFRDMAHELKNRFHEIAEANETLEYRVFQRTEELTTTNRTLLHEIDERKKAEKQRDHLMDELVRQLRFLQTLIDALPTPTFYKNRFGIYQGCNKAFEQAYGLQPGSVTGKQVGEIFPPEMAEIFIAADNELLSRGGTQHYETGIVFSDGIEHTVILNKATYNDTDGKIDGLIGNFTDITDRKQVEKERDRLMVELQSKNKELEGIIYVASHDLRSPLVNIQGFSRKLSKSCEKLSALLTQVTTTPETLESFEQTIKDTIPKSIEFITSSVEKMDSLLNGLLRLSRLGRASLVLESLDMEALMGKIISSSAFQIEKSGCRVILEQLQPCFGDATMVNQVFSNLLDNAIKYRSPDRPLEITISSEVYPEGIHYCVADNGIGIPQDQQKQIWEIFHRLDPKATEGEGLGLTMARRMLDRMEGAIWVESEPGTGSQFYVMLPSGTYRKG
jgi:PAS domain S-box-containing protein